VRLSDGTVTLAYSGDTEWTDALLPIADGAALFIVECSGYAGRIPYHLTWEILKSRLSDLRARRVMITHMNPAALAHLDEIKAAGVLVAADGDILDL
jgi:ribonuclease BN (tRNA processing enzyme)